MNPLNTQSQWFTVFKPDKYIKLKTTFNLIPFKNITNYITHINDFNILLHNLLNNIISLIPIGFLLPFVSNKTILFKNNLKISLVISTIIELSQLVLSLGFLDIDDIILHLIGTIIGWTIFFKLSSYIFLKKS